MTTNDERGHYYQSGDEWFVDAQFIRNASRDPGIVVWDSGDGYRIRTAGQATLHCRPVQRAFPQQIGPAFFCGKGPEDGRLVAMAARSGKVGIPTTTDSRASKDDCGCSSCSRGDACPCGKNPADGDQHDVLGHVMRLIMSESLGTLLAHQDGESTLSIHVPYEGVTAPEWVAGRFHECIREVIRFPEFTPGTMLGHVVLHERRPTIRWSVMLDRRRAHLLEDLVRRAVSLAAQASRGAPAHPVSPPHRSAGAFAWGAAAEVAADAETGTCETCPYALGTNLRCPACRTWQRSRILPPVADQEHLIAKVLHEQDDLEQLTRASLDRLAAAVAQILASNKVEPLTDLFFLRLERAVLAAIRVLELRVTARDTDAILDVVEALLSEPGIRLGSPKESP
jgi:hypothetical protein